MLLADPLQDSGVGGRGGGLKWGRSVLGDGVSCHLSVQICPAVAESHGRPDNSNAKSAAFDEGDVVTGLTSMLCALWVQSQLSALRRCTDCRLWSAVSHVSARSDLIRADNHRGPAVGLVRGDERLERLDTSPAVRRSPRRQCGRRVLVVAPSDGLSFTANGL